MSRYPQDDWFGNFIGPIQQALQFRAFLDDLKYRRELRQRDREDYAMQLEDRRRNRAVQDFQIQSALQGIGASPVEPGTVGKFRAGLGGRGTINAPSGQQYSMPTPQQQEERALRQLRARKTAEALGEAEGAVIKERALQPFKTTSMAIPGLGPFGAPAKVNIPNQNVASVLETIARIRNGKIIGLGRSTDKDGNVTLTGIDANTKEPIKVPLGPIGKPLKETASGLTPYQQTQLERQDLTRQEHDIAEAEKARVTAQEAIDTLRSPDAARSGYTPDYALQKVREAVDAYPDLLEGGIAPGQTVPYVKWKGGKRPRPSQTAKGGVSSVSPARTMPVLPAANVAEAAKRKGMSVEEFRKWFAAQGGTIH